MRKLSAALLAIVSASGCASFAVTDQKLEQNTAFALGLDKEDFTVSDRMDDGLKTTYSVKTKSGKKYNCYIMGTVGITGIYCNGSMPMTRLA